MQIAFQLWIHLDRLGVHLGDDPAFFQELIQPHEVLVVVDVFWFGKIAAVAD